MPRRGSIIETAAARLRTRVSPLVDRALRQSGILGSAFVSAKLLPIERDKLSDGEFFLGVPRRHPADDVAPDGLPMPPEHLQEGWGSRDAYLGSGRRDTETMIRILASAGVDVAGLPRVLDFGSAAGRMLRFFPLHPDGERWGVDIKAKHAEWCNRNLSPPFRFVTTTTFPHLPFEDGYFDLVYCGSVFTHIGELADAWLLELRRIVRPDGHIYVTIHDEHSIEILRERYPERSVTKLIERVSAERPIDDGSLASFAIGMDPWTLVFYDSGALVERWSMFVDVVSVTPEAMDYQTAVLMRKRHDSISSTRS